jgi:hypothetical protein
MATGHAAEAQILLQQAQEIFHRIGAAEAADIAGELRALTPAAGNQQQRAEPDSGDQPGNEASEPS